MKTKHPVPLERVTEARSYSGHVLAHETKKTTLKEELPYVLKIYVQKMW